MAGAAGGAGPAGASGGAAGGSGRCRGRRQQRRTHASGTWEDVRCGGRGVRGAARRAGHARGA
eukprot:352938-Chlamydomonas_euryale.AAC.2